MKKALSLILCICMLVPLLTFLTYAEGDGQAATPTNVGGEAIIAVSSSYNDYTPSTSINDGKTGVGDNGDKWSPNTPQRDPSLEGLSPWFSMTFDSYYLVSEVSLLMALSNTSESTVKFEAKVDGEWTELGILKYQDCSAYNGHNKIRELKVTIAEPVNTKEIKVTFTKYTSWDPPCVYECLVMAVPGEQPAPAPGDTPAVDTSHHYNIAPEAIPSVYSNYYDYSKGTCLNDNIIDDQINETNSSYIFWRPQTPQRDPAVEGTNPWFILKFNKYMEISKISVLVELFHTAECSLKFEALIQGEWVEIGSARYSQSQKFEDYKKVRDVSIKIPETVTTKQIKVTFFGYTLWDPPTISECRVTGAEGKAPEFDVPEGAYLTTNAALGGYGGASSSQYNYYPALGNDDNPLTRWQSSSKTDGQWYAVEFDKPHPIGEVGVNLSSVKLIDDEENPVTEVYNFGIKVELLVNGTWTKVYEGNVATSEGADAIYTKTLDTPLTASAMRVTYVETNDNYAVLSELFATTSDGSKCMYIGDTISIHQKLSTAAGNLACLGAPYASSTFTYSNMSDVIYINDGLVESEDNIWVPETPSCPVYCGIVLHKKMSVDTVVLYFNDDFGKFKDGDWHVSSFDVQYKNEKGEYVTVASGTSVDEKTGKSIVAIRFTPVETDDIRIVFTSNGGTFPYLKELEIYSHTAEDLLYVFSQYVALPTTRGLPTITSEFAGFTVSKRPALMKKYPLTPMFSAPVVNVPTGNDQSSDNQNTDTTTTN